MLLPGLCIVLFAVGANLAGDAIRDLLDPQRRRSRASLQGPRGNGRDCHTI